MFWARPAGSGGQAGNIGVNVVAWEDSEKGCPVSWPACCWLEHAGRDLLVCCVLHSDVGGQDSFLVSKAEDSQLQGQKGRDIWTAASFSFSFPFC